MVNVSEQNNSVSLASPEEGELETLVNSFATGMLQPRSGPHYQEHDLSGSRKSSYSMFSNEYSNARPSYSDQYTLQQMDSKKIPSALIEYERIVDINDPAYVDFDQLTQSILNQLLSANHSTKEKEFKFLLSDSDEIRASILPVTTPPIIILSKGAIQKLDSIDELAAIIGHEMAHRKLFEETDNAGGTNPGEASADIYAVHLLQDTGFSPMAMLSMLDKLHESRISRERKDASAHHDPHPAYSIRKRNAEDAIGYIESKKALNHQKSKIAPDIKRKISDAKHTPYIASKLDMADFENLPLQDKVSCLLEIWDSNLSNSDPNPFYQRFEDFEKALKQVVGQCKQEFKPEFFDPFLERLLKFEREYPHSSHQFSDRVESIYLTLSKAYGGYQDKEHGYQPFGILGELKTAMQGFIDADSQTEAEKHALKINKISNNCKLSGSLILEHIRWPDFNIVGIRTIDEDLRAGRQVALPWKNHQKWADNSDAIKTALGRFFISDSNIDTAPKEDLIIGRSVEWFRFGYKPEKNLIFDEDGFITSHNIPRVKRHVPKPIRFSNRYDSLYLNERDKDVEELLKIVDWSFLESDFQGFIEKYKDQLMPQITTNDGGDKFQKAFCEKLQALISRDGNDELKQKIYDFFTSNDQKKSGHSVQSLLAEFRRFHNVSAGIKTPPISSRFNERSFLDRHEDNSPYQVGLSSNTPYISFLMSHPAFTNDQKVKFEMMSQTRWRNKKADEPEDIVNFDFREVFGYNKPENASDLYKVMETLKAVADCGIHHGDSKSELLKTLMNIEIYSYLKLKNNESLDIEKLVTLCEQDLNSPNSFFAKDIALNFMKGEFLDFENNKKHFVEYTRLMDRQLDYMLMQSLASDQSAQDTIKTFIILSFGNYKTTSFFDRRPGSREKFQDIIKDKLEDIESLEERTLLLRNLLCDVTLKDPEFRSWVSQRWIEDQGALLRKSDTNERLMLVADDIIAHSKMGQSVFLLNGLLTQIQAQSEDCYKVQEKLNRYFISNGIGSNIAGAANDYVLERVGDEPKMRQNFLDFITEPYSVDSAEMFIDEAKKLPSRYQNDLLRMLQKDEDDNGIEITEEGKLNAVHNLHRNFWSLPFVARTLYLERVIFPAEEHSDTHFEGAVKFITDKILPEGQKYSKEARLVLDTHLEQCSKPLRRLIFSALITASEKNTNKSENIRPGQVLSHVLSNSGAAGGKILQAIHSYLQSISNPDDDLIQFRDDLKSSKSNYNTPLIWDMFKRVEEVHPNFTDIHVTEQLGSGSYGFTVAIIDGDANKSALTVTKKDVGEEANYQFGLFKKTAEKLSLIDPIWGPLVGILENAQSMAHVEADFDIAAKQIKYAEQLYNGSSVIADGYRFKISTASLKSNGSDYKETEMANGEHFLDLPEQTSDEKRYKKAAAKAILAIEIHTILKGQAFDYDRHGAQCKLKGGYITLFDHGSIPYDVESDEIIEPTIEDRLKLGEILGEAYAQSEQGNSMVEAMVKLIAQESDNLNESSYLQCFQRGILALSDYMNASADNEEEKNNVIKDIVMQSIKTGLVDQHIITGALNKIDLNAIKSEVNHQNRVIIKDPRSNIMSRLCFIASQAFSTIKQFGNMSNSNLPINKI